MTEPANWYEDMAKAIKEREKCQAAIDRWTAALQAAEARMAELGAVAPARPPVVQGTAEATIGEIEVDAVPGPSDPEPAQV